MSKAHTLTRIALCAALLCICSWITIPAGPVPFTMQTFGIFAVLGLLGGRNGTLAILLYLFLGLVGLPVFSGFGGGIGQILGPTGGYLLGFLLGGLAYWGLTARFGIKGKPMAFGMLLCLGVCYLFGTLWFWKLYGGTLLGTLTLCVFPYLIPDGIKLALALLLVRRIGGRIG